MFFLIGQILVLGGCESPYFGGQVKSLLGVTW